MKFHSIKVLLGLFLLTFISKQSFAQSRAAFQSLLYPRSVASSGLGEQGVASMNALDAMQYNPANLAYADGFEFSFFRNPWNLYGFSVPLTAYTLSGNLGPWGSIGVEYTDWDFGDIMFTTAENPDEGRFERIYERSVAGGYALALSDQVAVGAQVRYVWRAIPDMSHFFSVQEFRTNLKCFQTG